MKANEIVERFKNVLLNTDVKEETAEEQSPVAEEQVELSEDVKDIQVEAAEEVKETEEVEMTEELEETEEVKEEVEDEDKMEKYATKEDLAKAMAEMKGMIEELTAQKEELEVPTELSNQEPAVEPLSHSPEAEVSKKPTQLFAQNRSKSTLDKVMSKITNN
mgnify:FL=1|tara:strand:- start:988 stop:1473 length:486 start_codon:yes stop_codon:yes gene_type:complete